MRSESGRPKGRCAISPVVGIVILMLMTVAAYMLGAHPPSFSPPTPLQEIPEALRI